MSNIFSFLRFGGKKTKQNFEQKPNNRRRVRTYSFIAIFGFLFLFSPNSVLAASTGDVGHSAGLTFLFLGILLISAKVGSIVEKIGQPAVIGELFAGVVLSFFAFIGFDLVSEIRTDSVMAFFAELGAVILLFQIGLESNISQMVKVGVSAFLVALVGVVVPFVTGTFILAPFLFPESSFVSHLFLGASLVATSVGITASVFQELKALKTRACQIVLGAAVIDDVLGLLILAVVSALASGGSVGPEFLMNLAVKAFGFLALAVLLGNILARTLSKIFSSISTGMSMKLTLALTFALGYAYLATLVGLAPIVGAFAAGLILDAVHFGSFNLPSIAFDLKRLRGFDEEEKAKIDKLIEKHKHAHVEDLIASIALLLVPIFFVYTGLQIDFASLLDPSLYVYAIGISIVAVIGKVLGGIFSPGDIREKLLVGTSMVPRGEVGLIFASVGLSLGAVDSRLFSVIIMVIIITTFIAPPTIKMLLKGAELEKL